MNEKKTSLKTYPLGFSVSIGWRQKDKWKRDFETELQAKCKVCWKKQYESFCEILCSHKLTPKEILGK